MYNIQIAELNRTLDIVSDGICLIDKEFNILRVYDTYSTLSGISKDGTIGKKCYEVLLSSLCHTPECPLTRIFNGENFSEYVVNQERNDGIIITCVLNATPLRDSNGKLIGIIEIIKNFTENLRSITQIEIQQREISLLEQLITPNKIPLTSEIYGIKKLRERQPKSFHELVQYFETLVDLKIEDLIYVRDENISEKLQFMAKKLSVVKADPQDIIEIFSIVVKKKINNKNPKKDQIYLEEGRLLLIKLMGNLISIYRNYAMGASYSSFNKK